MLDQKALKASTGDAVKRHHPVSFLVLLTAFVTGLASEHAAAQGALDTKTVPQASSQSDRSQQPVSPDATPPFTTQFKGRLTIRDNRTATEVTTKRIKILSQGVVQSLSQQQVQFVEGMQKLETLEAFTEKADGRHVAVDAANIITRDAASGLQATYASDLKIRTFIFPDVAVGDTLVMTLKSDILRDFFAGQLTETGLKKVQISYEGVVAQMAPAAARAGVRQGRISGPLSAGGP